MQTADTTFPQGKTLIRDILVTATQGDAPNTTAFPINTGTPELWCVALLTPQIAFLAGDYILAFAGFELTNKLAVPIVAVGRLGLAANSDDVPGLSGWTFIDKDGGGSPVLINHHRVIQRNGAHIFTVPMTRRINYAIKAYRSQAPGTENAIWENTDVKMRVLVFR